MSELENVQVALLFSNNSGKFVCPLGGRPGFVNCLSTLTSSDTWSTSVINTKRGVRIVLYISSVSGTSPTLSISAQLGLFEPSITIIPSSSPITSTGTWVIHISEDGTVTLNANGTLSTIGKISFPVDRVILSLTVGGTSPSFDISAWVEFE